MYKWILLTTIIFIAGGICQEKIINEQLYIDSINIDFFTNPKLYDPDKKKILPNNNFFLDSDSVILRRKQEQFHLVYDYNKKYKLLKQYLYNDIISIIKDYYPLPLLEYIEYAKPEDLVEKSITIIVRTTPPTMGYQSLITNITTSDNTAIGYNALNACVGSNNTAGCHNLTCHSHHYVVHIDSASYDLSGNIILSVSDPDFSYYPSETNYCPVKFKQIKHF